VEYKTIFCDNDGSFDRELNRNADLGWRVISSGFASMNECMNNSWWAIMERPLTEVSH